MKILVIGGTSFVGRHTVYQLLEGRHEVHLANRGKTNPTLFGDLRKIVGDRSSNEFLESIRNEKHFDAVIDFCAFYPKDIDSLLPVLSGLTNHYLQISSVSAYKTMQQEPIPFLHEEDPLFECTTEQAGDESMITYGNRKAQCERIALSQSLDSIPTTIFRPSLIYGEYDPTDRFAYWIWRVAQQRPYFLPDDGLCITRRTYAPDFARSIVKALHFKGSYHQAYNIAEAEPLSLRSTLKIIGNYLGVDPFKNAVPISADQLIRLKIKPWSDLPLWIPRTNLQLDTFKARKDFGINETPSDKAIQTACDSFLKLGKPPIAGLRTEVEQELIEKHNKF